MKYNILLITLLLFVGNIQAQEVWSLEKCIRYAREKSLSVRQASIGVEQSRLNLKQDKYNRYPNVSGSTSIGVNSGYSINPTTNTFESDASIFNSFGVDGSVLLYNAGRLKKSIEQSQTNLEAAKLDVEQVQNDIALNVANVYLLILLADEQLAKAKERLAQSQRQLDFTDKLIQAGTRARAERYDILAQIALDEQSIVSNQNNLDINYLNLKQLLQLPPETDLKVETPKMDVPVVDLDKMQLNQLYQTAINNQPNIQANSLRQKSAELGMDIARAGMYPTVSAFGRINTNYSSLAKEPNGDFTIEEQILDVEFQGTPAELSIFNPIPNFDSKGYFSQLGDNLGQNLGVSVSVPIYTRNINKINIERAELEVANQKLTQEVLTQQLKTNIQKSLADAKAGYRQYLAAQRTLEAMKMAYQNTEKRYNLGAVTVFEYTTAKNNLDNSEIDVIISKYDYIFRLKILDFYLGRGLTL